ncbi:MAG: hemerythrin domain-containing protein [Blastocatellia bacterium]
MDALNQLIQDHRKVAELFEQFEATENEQECQRIFQQIHQELEVHTQLEETALYPALQQYEELKDITLEAIEEHRQVKTLLREVSNLTKGSEKMQAKVKVMQENIEHHVKEEEKEMFPLIRQAIPSEDLLRIGQDLQQKRTELQKTAKAQSSRK